MKPFSHDMLRLAKLQSGRRLSLYNKWRPLMDGFGLTAILAYLERAVAHDSGTKELENRWAGTSPMRKYSDDATALGSRVGRLLVAFRNFIDAQTKELLPNDPLVLRGAELKKAIFPADVRAITKLPLIEEVAAVEVIVTQLQGPYAAHVRELGLEGLATRLAIAVRELRHHVDAGNDGVPYDDVEEANQRGLDYLTEVVCMIVAHFHDSDNPAHMAAREQFYAPLAEQDKQARAARRTRRPRNAKPGDSEPGGTPAGGSSGDTPTGGSSGNTPTSGSSGNTPTSGSSGNTPTSGSSGGTPTSGPSGNTPAGGPVTSSEAS